MAASMRLWMTVNPKAAIAQYADRANRCGNGQSREKIPQRDIHGKRKGAKTLEILSLRLEFDGLKRLCQGRFFLFAEPGFPFLILPHHQDGGGVEDGRIRTAEDTHQQDDHEVADAIAAKQRQRKEREHNG